MDLLTALEGAHPRQMAAITEAVLTQLPGVVATEIRLLDHDGTQLTLLGSELDAPSYPVVGSPAGAAVRHLEPVLHEVTPDQVDVHIALRFRAEIVGVLSVSCREIPEPADGPAAAVVDELRQAALQLAYVLASSGTWSDHVEVARRARRMTLPAEMQWANLPVQALNGNGFAAAGKLLPTYEVGGDLFDLSWGERGLWLSVVDGVGHGLRSSLLTHAATGAVRHSRRCGDDLAVQAATASQVLLQEWDGLNFVTALICQLDVEAGELRWVNAGHPAPLVLRDGSVQHLQRPAQRPLGLLRLEEYTVHTEPVRPGDRVVLFSDGVPEARRRGDERGPLGIERVQGALLSAASSPPADAVRAVVQVVAAWTKDEPRDDATMLITDVLPPAGSGDVGA